MSASQLEVRVAGEKLLLLADRALLWPCQSMLVVSDLHLGKTNHFRKHGIAVPEMAGLNNLWRLSALLDKWRPEHVVFLGDLFHSVNNSEWPRFVDFISGYTALVRTLVVGNHDILGANVFAEAQLQVTKALSIGPFLFTHDRASYPSLFNLFGHLHPAVRMKGHGRQRLTLPCFYFDEKERFGIMPSFGDFTGLSIVKATAKHRVYVSTGNSVMQVS